MRHAVHHYIFHPKCIFSPAMSPGQLPEILRELEAAVDVIRGDEILSNLDGRANVEHLVGAACGYEDCLSFMLDKTVTNYPSLIAQPAPKFVIEVEAGIMHRMSQPVRNAIFSCHLP
mmetsp:Transcript_40936/g.68009  ORF Transcript_40936/g.68009 Transcript_40936/m.68009 type:complete len:117 (-) Transcript_40936:207-557(-)